MLFRTIIIAKLPECGLKKLTNGTLFVVATPIGNRSDLSSRARQVLTDVDLIAAEDTRHTGRLLSHFGIKTRQIALHEHNEDSAVAKLIEKIQTGMSVALVSDAGTPLVSDPGYLLLKAAHENDIKVTPVPGPSAVIAALSVAGLPTDRFCFDGFLPAKRAARVEKLKTIRDEPRTLVFYESVHRVKDLISDMKDVLGGSRRAFVGRELSKLHEQCVLATLDELAEMFGDRSIPAKGEFVIVIDGAPAMHSDTQNIEINKLVTELAAVLPGKQAVALAGKLTGRRRNELYKLMLQLEK